MEEPDRRVPLPVKRTGDAGGQPAVAALATGWPISERGTERPAPARRPVALNRNVVEVEAGAPIAVETSQGTAVGEAESGMHTVTTLHECVTRGVMPEGAVMALQGAGPASGMCWSMPRSLFL